ncbi:MAG: hypothetical protein A4S09_13405 [Proteobacteria bacterium SG_bin7]|nr:MAG: hypothetical protein A4S09_13405 [Proteobacteria bacterium SG_bin7]
MRQTLLTKIFGDLKMKPTIFFISLILASLVFAKGGGYAASADVQVLESWNYHIQSHGIKSVKATNASCSMISSLGNGDHYNCRVVFKVLRSTVICENLKYVLWAGRSNLEVAPRANVIFKHCASNIAEALKNKF